MSSTPLKSNSNPLKRSRPVLSPFPQNVPDDSQNTRHHEAPQRPEPSLRSPARKKRKDPDVENRTPERESNRSQGSSRRSATPVVKYEPPCEEFTPPRNVVLQMSSVKPARGRMSTPVGSFGKGGERKVVVKLERSMSPFPIPPIDLTKPPPPPSPTDDPLLLLETPATVKPSEDTIDTSMQDDIFDDSTSNPIIFNPDLSLKTDAFDSDDSSEGIGEADGEFTGHFKFYKTPVKDDPPSSTTKQRRESWGRPVSPHPRKIDRSWGDSDEEDFEPVQKDADPSFESNPFEQAESPVTEQRMFVDVEDPTSDDEYILPGVVEVSSNDPRAAARAAAILKLHHSYIIDGTGSKLPRKVKSPSVKPDTSVRLEPRLLTNISGISSTTDRHQTRSPSVSYGTLPDMENYQSEREWTKTDWKMLDTCFTDERFAVAEASGKLGVMVDVEDIKFDSVIDRFIAQCNDPSWDRTMLLRRVQILLNRQRLGRGAPRSAPPPLQTQLHSGNGLGSVPPMLLAPRYAYLRNELCSTKAPSRKGQSAVTKDKPRKEQAGPFTSPGIVLPVPQTTESALVQSPSQSGAKRVLNYLGSIINRYSPRPSSPPLSGPPEMRQLKGPVSTPVKMPVPKGVAPKEQVQLNEVIIKTPEPPEKPLPAKDIVNLNHVEPPPSVRQRTLSIPLLKSKGSVKDLVKCFEEVGKKTRNEVGVASKQSLRKTASVGNLNTRPSWKL